MSGIRLKYLVLVLLCQLLGCTSASRNTIISKGELSRSPSVQKQLFVDVAATRDSEVNWKSLKLTVQNSAELAIGYGINVIEFIELKQPVPSEALRGNLKIAVLVSALNDESRLIDLIGRIRMLDGKEIYPSKKLIIQGPCVIGAETAFPHKEVDGPLIPTRSQSGKNLCIEFLYGIQVDPRNQYEFDFAYDLATHCAKDERCSELISFYFRPFIFEVKSRL